MGTYEFTALDSLLLSYQHKVDSDLAEYLVQQFAPEEVEPEEDVSSPIVEETVAAISGGTSSTTTATMTRRERRQRMSRSLQRLHTMDPRLMEAESRLVL